MSENIFLSFEKIHTLFHISNFNNIPENSYEIENIQVVHKRRVSKRLYFFDARFYQGINNEICEKCQKISFILKYPELEIDVIHNIQKNIKLGDKVKIICWVENMSIKNDVETLSDTNSIDNTILFHIKDVKIIEKYNSKIAFIPELPIINKNNKINKNDKNDKNNDNDNLNKNVDNNCRKSNEINKFNQKENSNSNTDIMKKEGICKFWLNGKNCLRGDKCPFRHITNEELKKQWIDDRLNKRKFNFNNKDDFIDPHDKAGHNKRAHIFANWLVEHFGNEYLNSGSGVLDIAGGRGATSFELTVNHRVHSTLLEPRPAKLDKKQMRLLYDLKRKELLNNTKEHKNNNEQNNHINDNSKNNIKDSREDENNDENNNIMKEKNNESLKPKRFKLKKNINIDIPFSQIQCMVSLDTSDLYKDLFDNSSILIGLHPDQATEIIVDLALKLKKPFAIIPCCVFANDFPHRKLKRKKTDNNKNDNEYEDIPVSSYEQFIEYLCEKDKKIQKTFLPFEGKNLLLYKDK
ncbi:hypothetical protein BCR32DRAFT_289606 [Anaeromyces robustus]|uniref:C3H1-type domain-containing protein n=1 Tax=Anaeromyces robustus TaxID=1754192 RepID=A0A1Y1XMU4_9FUNG|nr:hypothetical protein BCR32DRAFT_289606 [Anaeromyces robustus]|eukprot:ORX87069.1 hypothetical protein BCR32DRAFT_289606 [Anaeromyces robustus]